MKCSISLQKQKDKKEAKRLYDIEYRRKNKAKIKALKAERYQRDKHKYAEREKEYRRKTQKQHNEYCMRPEYVSKKRIWDVVYRSMKNYGSFWESAVLLNQIEIEVRKRIPKNERLGYKRNVRSIINRNIRKRLTNAINRILSGEITDKKSIKNFSEERRQFLESLLNF
jgi:hypothetical protein